MTPPLLVDFAVDALRFEHEPQPAQHVDLSGGEQLFLLPDGPTISLTIIVEGERSERTCSKSAVRV